MEDIYNEIQNLNKLDIVSNSERLCKLFEESGELAQAVNKTIGRKVSNQSEKEIKSLICEEAADTIQCVISLIDGYDITYDELLEMIRIKNKKWEKILIKNLEK